MNPHQGKSCQAKTPDSFFICSAPSVSQDTLIEQTVLFDKHPR